MGWNEDHVGKSAVFAIINQPALYFWPYQEPAMDWKNLKFRKPLKKEIHINMMPILMNPHAQFG